MSEELSDSQKIEMAAQNRTSLAKIRDAENKQPSAV